MVVAHRRSLRKLKEAEITEEDSPSPKKYFNEKLVPALGNTLNLEVSGARAQFCEDMVRKKLMPMDAESQRVIDWLEKGIYDALQRKYLKTLMLSLCESVDGPMIEEYSFLFSYSDSESQDVMTNTNRTGNKKQGGTFNSTADITPNQTRSSACKMAGTLVQFMRTLDKMPDVRTTVMKLLYYDNVTLNPKYHQTSGRRFTFVKNAIAPEDYMIMKVDEKSTGSLMAPAVKGINVQLDKDGFISKVGKGTFIKNRDKLKSVLDPCEHENEDMQDDGRSVCCIFFAKGFCPFGNDCWFSHQAGGNGNNFCRFSHEASGSHNKFLPDANILVGNPISLKNLRHFLKREKNSDLTMEDAIQHFGETVTQFFNNDEPKDGLVKSYVLQPNNFVLRWESEARERNLPVAIDRHDNPRFVGPVRDQGKHELCCAFVVTDLVSAARVIDNETDQYEMLSVRDICFFADQEERKSRKSRLHQCHPLEIYKGLEFMASHGAGVAEAGDDVFSCKDGNRPDPKGPKIKSHGTVNVGNDIEAILTALRTQPLGATIAVFQPEYEDTGVHDVYYGPTSHSSTYSGFHGVLVTKACMRGGQLVFKCKSSHGSEEHGGTGYLHVSALTMLMGFHGQSTLNSGLVSAVSQEDHTPVVSLTEPQPLIAHFYCPQLRSNMPSKRARRR